MTRSPISAWVTIAPAPIAQSRPIRTSGADHRVGADQRAAADLGAAGRSPRRGSTVTPSSSRAVGCDDGALATLHAWREQRRRPQRMRETARAPPSTKARYGLAHAATADTSGRHVPAQALRVAGRRRHAWCAQLRGVISVVEEGRDRRAGPVERRRHWRCAALRAPRRPGSAPVKHGDLSQRSRPRRVSQEDRLAHATSAVAVRRGRHGSELGAAAEPEELRLVVALLGDRDRRSRSAADRTANPRSGRHRPRRTRIVALRSRRTVASVSGHAVDRCPRRSGPCSPTASRRRRRPRA